MSYDEIIKENRKRLERIQGVYNPTTGEGSDTFERVRLELPDAPVRVQFVPRRMLEDNLVCRELRECGTVKGYLLSKGIGTDEDSFNCFLVEFVRLRIRYDFEYFAAVCLTIKDKLSKADVPFVLNRGQRKLLKVMESQRLSGAPIRVILLKARQWGGSTLVQLYMFWIQLIHKRNWNSIICAHTKDAAKNIRGMFTNALIKYPCFDGVKLELQPYERTDNIKYIPTRGCRITVGSAESPNSVRSQDAAMVHYSEVAFFPDTEGNNPAELIGSVSSSVTRTPYSMIVYESTAKGIGNFFHSQWLLAKESKSAFLPVFVAWYEIDIYSEALDVPEDEFIRSFTDYELLLWRQGATLEAINWYRHKRMEQPSESSMREEFPTDDIEAFQHSGQPVFNVSHVERMRKDCAGPEATGEVYGDALASEAKLRPEKRKAVLESVRFEAREDGNLKIWAFPDREQSILYRYLVTVDTGGRSRKADFSVITVIDRYWLMFGGKPEVVAQWRGHIDHDILAWTAAQIATFYCHALLVFESNTAETEQTDGDHTEFIFDTLARCYDNLYSRTSADQIRQGVPAKWGFHTNKSTKPLIIDNYTAIIREQLYVERDEEALNEARWYEKKQNGSFGAIEGQHDDVLMTRMIGLYICFDMPLPCVVEAQRSRARNRVVGEATI